MKAEGLVDVEGSMLSRIGVSGGSAGGAKGAVVILVEVDAMLLMVCMCSNFYLR